MHAVLLLPSALPVHLIVLRVSARAGFGGSWPRFFSPTQTTAFWGCWSRGKESERPRLLWRGGDSERNSPRKPRRHSEHTDTLFLQKYTICFNDQYQKTKAKSPIETSDWNTEVGTTRVWTRCRAWIYQKKQTKKKTSLIMNTLTPAPTTPVHPSALWCCVWSVQGVTHGCTAGDSPICKYMEEPQWNVRKENDRKWENCGLTRRLYTDGRWIALKTTKKMCEFGVNMRSVND